MIPVVTKLLKEYSKLNMRLLLQDRMVDLVQEHMDIGIRIGHLQDSSLISRQIGTVRKVICASPQFLEKQTPLSHPNDLKDQRCILFDGYSAGTHWLFQDNGKPISVSVEGSLACNSMTSKIQACVGGVGYGAFFSYQIAEQVQKGALEILLEDFEPTPHPVQLIYPHARLLSSRIQFVLNVLETELRSILKTRKYQL